MLFPPARLPVQQPLSDSQHSGYAEVAHTLKAAGGKVSEVRSLLCPLALILADSQMLTWIPVVRPMVSRAVVDWPPLTPVPYGN